MGGGPSQPDCSEIAFQAGHPRFGTWLPSPALGAPWKSCLLADSSVSNCSLGAWRVLGSRELGVFLPGWVRLPGGSF